MDLAKNLQMLRKMARFSQEELAEKCQVSRQAIAKWERGDSVPTIDKLVYLADLYNVSLDQIVGRTETNLYANSLGIKSSMYLQKKRELLDNRTAFENIVIEEGLKNIGVGKICAGIADSYGITKEDIIGKGREPLVREARFVSMYFMRQLLKMNAIEIGEYMNRDVTLVVYALHVVNKLIETEEGKKRMLGLREKILDTWLIHTAIKEI